ncbi:class F sortase [Nocardioides sp.]|uniref:class F sortase n=1 Tax=Nocardioides sp. TaxID=35761 RepID=UPI002B26F953|nr:class F sortase [Nocardioides sp.]
MTGNGPGLLNAERRRTGVTAVLVILVAALALAILDGPETRVVPGFSNPAGDSAAADGSAVRTSAQGGGDALIVPTIGLNAALIDIQIDPDGVLTPPSDYTEVGYWDGSASPGARSGQTVVTGHTVHTGGGVMNRLGSVVQGDPLQIRFDGDLVDYRVRKVVTMTKAEVAAAAQDLFGQDRRKGRLVLVTCTDWDGADYQSNIIVFADEYRPV